MSDFHIVIENFDQLGADFDQLGGNYRRVQISGTATALIAGAETLDSIRGKLAGFFTQDGWQLLNFAINSSWFSDSVDINIIANVPGDYTNQQHLDRAYQLFNNYTIYSVWNSQPFSQLRLDISATEDKAGYVTPPKTTVTNTPPPPPAGATQAQIEKYNADLAAAGKKKDLLTEIYDALNPTKLLGTAGISVGVVAGILVLAVILKR